MSYELHDGPRSPWSLCGSVVENWGAESEGLRFNSSWGLRIFSFSHAHEKTKKNIFLYVTSLSIISMHYPADKYENTQTYPVEVVIMI